MNSEFVFETLKQYFNSEISNSMNISKDNIILILNSGKKIKISTKETI